MALELPGVTRIDTATEARSHALRWDRMAREVDTPDATDEVKAKARELRQRASAARSWARRQEQALEAGRKAGAAEDAKVTPIRGGTAEQQHGPVVRDRGETGHGFASSAARETAHRTYHAARPAAMRLGVRGRQHFFEGLSEPFGPVGSGWDLVFEALGTTIAIVFLFDLLRAPGALVTTTQHARAGLDRLVGLTDPITGLAPTAAGSARPGASTTRPAASTAAVAS